ncbi:MAG: translation elongation factor Ts [bacterium]|nr:translation elongation factor Ts [bacterium]
MTVDLKLIQQLRQASGAGVMDVKKALEEAGGDVDKAREVLKQKGLERAAKKKDRETKEGYIGVYQHHNGKAVGVVVLLSETDFVARNRKFKQLAYDLAMQACSMRPASLDELMESDFIKQPGTKVKDVLDQAIATLGENIQIKEVKYFQI